MNNGFIALIIGAVLLLWGALMMGSIDLIVHAGEMQHRHHYNQILQTNLMTLGILGVIVFGIGGFIGICMALDS